MHNFGSPVQRVEESTMETIYSYVQYMHARFLFSQVKCPTRDPQIHRPDTKSRRSGF